MTRVGDVLQGSLLEEQINLETEAVTEGVARYRRLAHDAITRNDGASLKPAERLMVYWIPLLTKAIKEEQRGIAAGEPGRGRGVYGPVLWKLDADRLAVIALHEMLSRTMVRPAGETVLKVTYAIGSAVLAEIHHDIMRADPDCYALDDLERRFKNITPARVNQWAKKSLDDTLWNRTVCTQVGSILMHLVLNNSLIQDEDVYAPAFEHGHVYRQGGRRTGVVKLSPCAWDLIEDGHMFRQSLRPRYLPMIVVPYPWSECDDNIVEGGYTRIRTPFISKPTSDQRSAIKNASKETLYEGLNAINSVPWKLNGRMLDLQKAIFDQGGGCGIPQPDLHPMPPKPSDIETNDEALKEWKKAASEVHSENAKLKGARIEFLQRHSVGEKFRGYDQIWYPNQFDFRYRHYPIPATSPNHHGPDAARACMLFGNGVPVDDDGMAWLYVQAASHFGHDKLSYDDRIDWTESNIDQLKEWGERPLDTQHEWGQAEHPFLFMNCCWALFDPEMAAHLPGHVDGSNNVNQHYGAVGLCEDTAKKVNMLPAALPHDPYMDSVKLVIDEIVKRSRAGDEVATQVLPYMTTDEKMARSYAKRPSMTRSYNSTRVGARNQVQQEMIRQGVPREVRRKHGNYLADIIHDQVANLFPSSHNLMTWLETCARLMCKADPSQSISWMSPLGVPVVQPYRNPRKYRVNTIVQDILLGHRDTDSPISLAKQVQGLPPNWVHSLDAAHALFTAIVMFSRGLVSAFVHDCYWAHLSNMNTLGTVLREQFVLLHENSQAIAAWEEWSERFPDLDLPPPPARGNLDLNQVMLAQHFFG